MKQYDCVTSVQMSRVCIVVLEDEDHEVSVKSKVSKVRMIIVFSNLAHIVALSSPTSKVFSCTP